VGHGGLDAAHRRAAGERGDRDAGLSAALGLLVAASLLMAAVAPRGLREG
jgi:hypothetical protein